VEERQIEMKSHLGKPERARTGIHERSRAIKLSSPLIHTALVATGLKDVGCRSEPGGVCPCRAAAVGIIAYLDAGAQAMVARTIKPYGVP
jgi:hypothetical protein